ncbi:hypothetical protein TWF281_007461 [Arthrobotrys megalospora]
MLLSKLESLPPEISNEIGSLLQKRDLCRLVRCSKTLNNCYLPQIYITFTVKSNKSAEYRSLIRRARSFLRSKQDVCGCIRTLIVMSGCARGEHEFADETLFPVFKKISESGNLRLLHWNMVNGSIPGFVLDTGSLSAGLVTLSIDLRNPRQLAKHNYMRIGSPSIRKLSLRNIFYHAKNFTIVHDFIHAAESLSHVELQFIHSSIQHLHAPELDENYTAYEDEEIKRKFGDINSFQELFCAAVYTPLAERHKPYSLSENDLYHVRQLLESLRPGLETLVFLGLYNDFKPEKLNDTHSRSPYCTHRHIIKKHSQFLQRLALHESASTGIERELLHPGESHFDRPKSLSLKQVSLAVNTDLREAGAILGEAPTNGIPRIKFSSTDIRFFGIQGIEILHVVPHNWAFIAERRAAQRYYFPIERMLKEGTNNLIKKFGCVGYHEPDLKYVVLGLRGQNEFVFRVRWTATSSHDPNLFDWQPHLAVEKHVEDDMVTLKDAPIFRLYPLVAFESTHHITPPFKG